MKVYLAHPMNKRFFVRDVIQKKLEDAGIEVLNPFVGEGRENIFFNKKYKDSVDLQNAEFNNRPPEKIVAMEKKEIEQCDGVFAYVPHEAFGTGMEIMYNSLVLGRGKEKTFVYIRPEDENRCYLIGHPWLLTHATTDTDIDSLITKVLNT